MEFVDPIGRSTRLEYDTNAQLTRVTRPGGRGWQFERDRVGRVIRATAPDGSTTRHDYERAGRMVREHRADRTIARRFDALGHVIAADWGRGLSTAYRYGALGRLVEAHGEGQEAIEGTERLWFDARDRLTRVQTGGGSSFTIATDRRVRPTLSCPPHRRYSQELWIADGRRWRTFQVREEPTPVAAGGKVRQK